MVLLQFNNSFSQNLICLFTSLRTFLLALVVEYPSHSNRFLDSSPANRIEKSLKFVLAH